MGLAKDLGGDQRLVIGNDAAGVDNFQGAAAPFSFSVDTVAGDAGFVGDDGAASPGKPIKQGGFADVGATDDDERGKSWGHGRVTVSGRWTPTPGVFRKSVLRKVLGGRLARKCAQKYDSSWVTKGVVKSLKAEGLKIGRA